MRRSPSRAGVALLMALLGAAVPSSTTAIRVDHEHDFDMDDEIPIDLDKDWEEDEDEPIDLDLGPGRQLKRIRMTPQPSDDWDLEKMLSEDESKRWDNTFGGGDPFEEMLGSFTSDANDEIDDWD